MRQIIIYLLLLLLFLSACSGTSESQASILLVIGFDKKVGLLDACLITSEIADDCPSSTIATEENERPLLFEHDLPEGSEPISFDITDRDNKRDELVVLSAKGSGNQRTAYLSFFRVSGINPDPQSAQLPESRSFLALKIENIIIDSDVSPQPTSFCPTDVQVDEEGRYIGFFSSNSTSCSGGLVDAIDIIDLQTSPPTLVRHIELGISFPKGFYIDQVNQRDDKLYYLQKSGSKVALTSLLLNDDITDNDEQEVTKFDNDEEVIDMLALGDKLIVLNKEDFIVIDRFRFSTEEKTNTVTATPFDNNKQIIIDDFFRTPYLYLLSDSSFVPYPTLNPTEEPKDASAFSITDGTFESINTFIYLLSNQSIRKFDALTFDFEDTPSLTSFTINALNNPKLITWVQATVF